MMQVMRTTVDLPDDVHAVAKRVARDRGVTFSEAVADLIRRGIGQTGAVDTGLSPTTGLPVVHLGRRVTEEDVRSLDDDS
jgi:hypothetical protein